MKNYLFRVFASVSFGMALLFSAPLIASEIKVQVFNPGTKSLFPVSSVLVTGPTEALLIDAQFQRDDAQTVLNMIKESGKKLTTIYISHGDPDYYFGLDIITSAYPNAKVLASPSTLAHINKTIDQKIKHWSPILKDNAPHRTLIPQELKGDTLSVDNIEIKVVGLDGHDPENTFVWIPSNKTVAGGRVLFENMHVWMADTPTQEEWKNWKITLANILALNPARIIPGHFVGSIQENRDSIDFTQSYVVTFAEETTKASNAAELIEAMKSRYPDFKNFVTLDISAKVIKGEMKWH